MQINKSYIKKILFEFLELLMLYFFFVNIMKLNHQISLFFLLNLI